MKKIAQTKCISFNAPDEPIIIHVIKSSLYPDPEQLYCVVTEDPFYGFSTENNLNSDQVEKRYNIPKGMLIFD